MCVHVCTSVCVHVCKCTCVPVFMRSFSVCGRARTREHVCVCLFRWWWSWRHPISHDSPPCVCMEFCKGSGKDGYGCHMVTHIAMSTVYFKCKNGVRSPCGLQAYHIPGQEGSTWAPQDGGDVSFWGKLHNDCGHLYEASWPGSLPAPPPTSCASVSLSVKWGLVGV